MKRYLTVGIIFGVLVVTVVTISWFAFPAWKNPTSGGFWTLLGLTLIGVLTAIKDLVSIWKELKPEEKKETQPSSTQSIQNQQGGTIYNVPGGHVTILNQPPTPSPEPTPEVPSFWHIPHPYPMPPNFTGRVAERTILIQWLNEDIENRLFIIRALGGFGKSALSWHLLTHDVDSKQWPKVLWWSFYEGDASFKHFIEETLNYLKLEVPQGQRPQVDELLKAMQSQKILLIMDGFERALRAYSSMNAAYQGDEEPKLEDNQLDCVNINAEIFLKSVCSLPNLKSKVLMTTRLTPRAVKPRREFMLGCREEELTAMQKADAVTFFHKQKIKGTHAEIESACEPYGYHPLSLCILAGLIIDDRKTPGDISVANKLEITDNIIQNKHHVLEVAYNTLPPERQKLLSTIACFRSPMNYEALKEISSKPLGKGKKAKASSAEKLDDNLKTLETRGLLHWDRKTNKYDLHPIVRRYAYERLIAPDRTAAHTRLRDYFAAVDAPAKLQTLDDLAPVIELYHHTVRAGKLDTAWQLFHEHINQPIYYQFGAYQLRIELLRALFINGEDKPPRLKDESAQAWTLNALSQAYGMSGQLAKAIALLNQQISIYKKLESKLGLAVSLANQADWLREIGILRSAESNLQSCITLLREIEHKEETNGHVELGRLLSYRGQWDKAKQEFGMTYKLYEKEQQIQNQCVVTGYDALCTLLMTRDPSQSKIKKHKSAIELSQHALELAEEAARTRYPNERDFIRVHWLLGAAYRLDDQLDLAEQHLNEALTRDRAINLVDAEADILLDLARLSFDYGLLSSAQDTLKHFENAKSLAEEALTITERCSYVLQGADVNFFLAQYALEQEKDKVKAKEYAETALKLAYCDGPPYYYKVAYEEAERMLESLNKK